MSDTTSQEFDLNHAVRVVDEDTKQVIKVMESVYPLNPIQQALLMKKIMNRLHSLAMINISNLLTDIINTRVDATDYSYAKAGDQEHETVSLSVDYDLPTSSNTGFGLHVSQTKRGKDYHKVFFSISLRGRGFIIYQVENTFSLSLLLNKVKDSLDSLKPCFPKDWSAEKITETLQLLLENCMQQLKITFL